MQDYVRDARYYEISLISVARFGEKERRAVLISRVLLGATYHATHIVYSEVYIQQSYSYRSANFGGSRYRREQ